MGDFSEIVEMPECPRGHVFLLGCVRWPLRGAKTVIQVKNKCASYLRRVYFCTRMSLVALPG